MTMLVTLSATVMPLSLSHQQAAALSSRRSQCSLTLTAAVVRRRTGQAAVGPEVDPTDRRNQRRR